jgi:hypothetical protein
MTASSNSASLKKSRFRTKPQRAHEATKQNESAFGAKRHSNGRANSLPAEGQPATLWLRAPFVALCGNDSSSTIAAPPRREIVRTSSVTRLNLCDGISRRFQPLCEGDGLININARTHRIFDP